MEAIGTSIRGLRDRSPHRDLRAFAEQAGLSYEGLRKIEIGERIPSIDTVDQIIQAVAMSKKQARKLRVARDLAHAEREGLLNKGVTDNKIDDMSKTCHDTVVDFLDEFDMELSDEDQEDLLARLTGAISGELRA